MCLFRILFQNITTKVSYNEEETFIDSHQRLKPFTTLSRDLRHENEAISLNYLFLRNAN